MTNIFYSYDSQTGSFSALPASPWLLPAMGAFALLAAYQKYKLSQPSIIGVAPCINPIIRDIYSKRYGELINKKHWGGGLTFEESIELRNIQYPPWAEPGEIWSY